MKSSGAGLFPIAILGLLAALTFWLDRATQGEDGGQSGRRRHDPDYTVDRFLVRRFDAAGALQHSLAAERMLHYPDDESTSVIGPRLTYHNTPPTHLTADTAWFDKDGKHVKLEGNVRITRESDNDRPPSAIGTSVLYIDPEDEIARTDAAVTITSGRSVINGVGLEANNKTRSAVMYGPVRGTIYPKQAQLANPTHEPGPNETHITQTPPAGKPARPFAGPR